MSVAFSPDGFHALTGDQDGIVRLWDLKSEEFRELGRHTGWVFNVAFSPDGLRGYSTGGGSTGGRGELADGPDSAIRVWDLETPQNSRKLEGHQGRVFGLAVSPVGHRILTGGDTTLILWNSWTGRIIRRWQGHVQLIRSVAFLPDGRHAVSCSVDKTIRLWEVDTGREVRQFGDKDSEAFWLAVSPRGLHLLSSHQDRAEVRLWDLETGELLQRIHWPGHAWDHVPTRGSFSRDGLHAVWGSGDGIVKVFRLNDPGGPPSGVSTPKRAVASPTATMPHATAPETEKTRSQLSAKK
jgi:WD40 repeat protein